MSSLSNIQFISLGYTCTIAHNINLYLGKGKTNMFDWVRTDFDVILDILNVENIKDLFNVNNFELDKKLFAHDNNLTISLKNFNEKGLCYLFHHEILLSQFTYETETQKLNEFIDKYIRRYNRLIEMIKNDNPLVFIYSAYQSNKFDESIHVQPFIDSILSINKDKKFCLVILEYKNYDNYAFFVKNPYHLAMNIYKFIDPNIPDTKYEADHIKWTEIFDLIKLHAFT